MLVVSRHSNIGSRNGVHIGADTTAWIQNMGPASDKTPMIEQAAYLLLAICTSLTFGDFLVRSLGMVSNHIRQQFVGNAFLHVAAGLARLWAEALWTWLKCHPIHRSSPPSTPAQRSSISLSYHFRNREGSICREETSRVDSGWTKSASSFCTEPASRHEPYKSRLDIRAVAVL